MKPDNAASASASGATSSKRPSGQTAPPPDAPPAKLSESEFLAQQAHNAQLAISKVMAEAKTRLGQGVDPGAWAREFPWVTVGVAAVAGFVTATALVPSKEQQTLNRLAKIERALNPPPPRREHANGDGEKKQGGGMLGTILHETLNVVRPMLVGLLSAGIAGQSAPPDPGQAPAEQ